MFNAESLGKIKDKKMKVGLGGWWWDLQEQNEKNKVTDVKLTSAKTKVLFCD